MTHPYFYYANDKKMARYYLLKQVMLNETIEDFINFHKKDTDFKPPLKNVFDFHKDDSNIKINNTLKVYVYIDLGNCSIQFMVNGNVIYDYYYPQDTTHFLYDEFLRDIYSTFIAPIPIKIVDNNIYYFDGTSWCKCDKVGTRGFFRDEIKSIDDILQDSIKPRIRQKHKFKVFCDNMLESMETHDYKDKNMISLDSFVMQTICGNQDVFKPIFEEQLSFSSFLNEIKPQDGDNDVLNGMLYPLIKLSPLFKDVYNETCD